MSTPASSEARHPDTVPPDAASRRFPWLDLLVVSFLLLFFELSVIRWVSATVRVVAYFSNIVMISCFLGAAWGCIARPGRDLFRYFPGLALALVVLCWHFGERGVENPLPGIDYFFGGMGHYSFVVAVPAVFVLNAAVFAAVGHRMGRELSTLTPLYGYSINLLGSLLGSAAFALVSFAQAGPTVWFVISFVAAVWLLRTSRTWLVAGLLAMGIGVSLVAVQGHPFLWSPYYKIRVLTGSDGATTTYNVQVNDDYHQLILDLDARRPDLNPARIGWRRTYDLPYLLARRGPGGRVLVLGAGTGNDVAAALRNGASEVVAVELDPAIAELGRRLHPERPYADPRVRLVITDARAYLTSSHEPFDVIVLGWLDSHRLFSSLSNVRQDNFVYTVEAMQRARELLSDDGVLVLSFFVGKPWLGEKIFAMLSDAFGHPPVVYSLPDGGYGAEGGMFAVSRDASRPPLAAPRVFRDDSALYGVARTAPPLDNWPYLYYRDRTISWEYLLVLGVLLGVSVLMVAPLLKGAGLAPGEAPHFFLLGAAFLLLEVRNVTNLALVFGSTWLVTSVVIVAIMVMALLANLMVARGWTPPPGVLWGLLLGSVLLSLLWSRTGTGVADFTTRSLLTVLVVSLTFVFSGMVFASSFVRVASPARALGFNILGCVIGGLAEYVSLVIGLDGLSWLALALYAAAGVALHLVRARHTGVVTPSAA